MIEVDRQNRQRRRRRGKSDPTDAEAAARAVLAGEAMGLPKEMSGQVEAVPNVLCEHGAWIDVAAKLVIAVGENPHRLRNEASFAALCGTSPIEASSGKHSAHRLNRGGNRQDNNALHTVAMHRWGTCPETRAHIERRKARPTAPSDAASNEHSPDASTASSSTT
ncbi:MAG TPA: transposase [Acidimicrobiales bacterium]|nr:transposase [Acidimicrobiales bacterium]